MSKSFKEEEKEGIARLFVVMSMKKDKWEYRKGYWIFRNAVAVGFDQICKKWNGPWGESPIKDSCVLLNHLLVVQNQRKNGLALAALVDLANSAEIAECGIVGVISPFTLRRKNIFDIGLAVQRMLLGDYDVLPTQAATKEIESVQRLFDNAGFERGFRLQGLTKFQNTDFPMDRQFAYIPANLDPIARDWLEAARLSEPIEVDCNSNAFGPV